MATLQTEGDPADVGMSAERLARIDDHFRQYVDDGRLPGWLISVSRRFTQLLPSSTHPIRSQLKQLVYQSIIA